MDIIQERLGIILGFVAGFFVGLVIFGWGLTPVEFTCAGPGGLNEGAQARYLRNVAELYDVTQDPQVVTNSFGTWDGAAAACALAANSPDPADAALLTAIATVANPAGCVGATAGATGDQTAAQPDEGGSNFLPVLVLGALLALLIIAILYVFNRRQALLNESDVDEDYEQLPDAAPVLGGSGEAEVAAIPLASFRTSYTRGYDAYDDSFSIENGKGDFLGECGVGISESIGTDLPKNVTAFEVWLFDKNDIRTITKVLMRDHAFYDEAIKAKLAPKGEPTLARVGETIVLETASLIINAEVVEMEYGTGTLPPQSFFDQFSFKLSAWAKEGDFEPPDTTARAAELMDY